MADRTGKRVLSPGQGKVSPFFGTVMVSGSDGNGTFELIEYVVPATPPPHVHRRDEAFVVLEGDTPLQLGGGRIRGRRGTAVHVPRGTRYGFVTGPPPGPF